MSCPQVKWGPVYTLFSDYNVVVLYDGTFVEVNQLQRSTQQLLSKICFVTITPPTSPSWFHRHPQTILTTNTICWAGTKIRTTTPRKNIVTITPRPRPLTLKQSSLLSLSPRLSSPLSPHICSQVIPAPWVKGQHCGVCGNFDGNTKNEMQDKVNILFHLDEAPNSDSIEIFDRPTLDLLPDWSHGACRHALKGLVPTVVPSRKWLFWCKK